MNYQRVGFLSWRLLAKQCRMMIYEHLSKKSAAKVKI